MKRVSFQVLFFLVLISLVLPKVVAAKEQIAHCDNRFVTLINPVRGRSFWIDKSINPLINQYSLIKNINAPTTWLLQYDTLIDPQLLTEIRKFDISQERGILLEVSPKLAEDARIIYPHAVPWFSPQAVFLSGYTQTERRRLIDKLFTEFKLKFGNYPKSVGAWWIDSYSLEYMKENYDISSAMIVADQKTTDSYGVWGQWWGLPYYPAKANILTPASNLDDKLNVVVIQWAQRDPVLAMGEGPKYSNYSLQANDYLERGKNTDYFNQLVDLYLNCQNPVGQVTVGLETGIESINFLDEYKNQLDSLKQRTNLRFVTMGDFAKQFRKIYPDFPKQAKIGLGSSVWDLTPNKRTNQLLGETIYYQPEIAFSDYFIKDQANFLKRYLINLNQQKTTAFFPWFLVISLGLLILSFKKGLVRVWAVSMIFALGAFGLVLRSYYQMGWKIYFGPEVPNLIMGQIAIVLISFAIFWQLSKWKNISKSIWVIPLVFGIDSSVSIIRFSFFSDRYYLGFAADALRFIGISIKNFADINFINQDFPSFISAAFLRVDFNHLWENLLLAVIAYPIIHIIIGIVFSLLLFKLPRKVQKVMLVILICLFLLHLNNIFMSDPRQVVPILLQ